MEKKGYLITELSYDLKPISKNDNMYLVGIFSSAEVENNNNRKYSKSILEREIKKLHEQKITNKSCFGELNHPPKPEISLDRVAVMVEDLEWKNNDVYGRAKVLKTPMGDIVKTLIDEGGNVGISSRGLGTVSKEGWVNEDFNLITYDVVSNPSNVGSWVKGIYEGQEFSLQIKEEEITEEMARAEFKKHIWQVLENIKKGI